MDAQKTEVEAFLRSLAGLKKGHHDDFVAACDDLLDHGKLIVGTHRLHEAKLRFSRSEEVKRLRSHLRELLSDLYTSTPVKVEKKIRDTHFEAADEELRRIEHVLGDALAHKELNAGIEGELKDLTWLREKLEKQRTHYQRLKKKGRDAIQAFNFKEALNICTQLEGDFTSEENRAASHQLGPGQSLVRAAGAPE